MPRENHPRQQSQPVSETGSGGIDTAPVALVSLLAHAGRLTDLLPQLHQHAIETTGGSCSLLFRHNPRNGTLQATSGFGLESLRTDPWAPASSEAALVDDALGRGTPALVTDIDRQMPDLASRLNVRTALLVPLSRSGERIGLLA